MKKHSSRAKVETHADIMFLHSGTVPIILSTGADIYKLCRASHWATGLALPRPSSHSAIEPECSTPSCPTNLWTKHCPTNASNQWANHFPTNRPDTSWSVDQTLPIWWTNHFKWPMGFYHSLQEHFSEIVVGHLGFGSDIAPIPCCRCCTAAGRCWGLVGRRGAWTLHSSGNKVHLRSCLASPATRRHDRVSTRRRHHRRRHHRVRHWTQTSQG